MRFSNYYSTNQDKGLSLWNKPALSSQDLRTTDTEEAIIYTAVLT
jgi:hypothetical protein